MGWRIANLDNTVAISKECADDLFAADEHRAIWFVRRSVSDKERMTFNPDHLEHMDYLWREEIQEVLKKHKVSGRITFGSLDGDNTGKFWGYEFDGDGGMKRLTGILGWEEAA